MNIKILLTYFSLLDIISIFLLITSFIFLLSMRKKIPLIKIFMLPNILMFLQVLASFMSASSNFSDIKFLSFLKILNITAILILLIYFIIYNSNKDNIIKFVFASLLLCILYIGTILDYIYKIGKIDYNFDMNSYFPITTPSIPMFLFICNTIFISLSVKKVYEEIKINKKSFNKKMIFEQLTKYERAPICIFEILFFILFAISLYSGNFYYMYNILETFIVSFLLFSLILSFFMMYYKKSPVLIFKVIFLSLFLITTVISIYLFNFSDYVNIKYTDFENLKIEEAILQATKNTYNYPKHISYMIDINENIILYSKIDDNILDKKIIHPKNKIKIFFQKKHVYQYRMLGKNLEDYYIENIVNIYDKQYIIAMPYIFYREYISKFYKPILISLISILFSLGIVYQFFLKYIYLKPIFYFLGIQNSVNDGNYNVVISSKGNDEISDISNMFKQMIEHIKDSKNKLAESNNEITKYNDMLEKMVESNNLALKKAYKNIVRRKVAREREMKMAMQLQKQLLISQNIDSINMSIIYNPTDIISGDIYDISEIKKGHIRIFLADATGHGIQAALFATLLKTEYNNIKYKATTSEVFEIFNKLFYTTYKNITTFFTSIVVDIFLDEKIIQYSSAGHPSQYAIIDGEIVELKVTQIMTSIMSEDYESKSNTLKYNNNYKIILFTDGLFELKNQKSKKLYQSKSLETVILKNIDKEINEILDSLIEDTSNFIGTKKRYDDITLIGVESK